MKYNQPYGAADPDAPYVDRNTPGAVKGSVPPAQAIEHPQREIVNAITAAGIEPDGDDLTQLSRAIDALITLAFSQNQSLTGAGYIKIPGGLIIQWTSGATPSNPTTITLPITYPNAQLWCGVSETGGGLVRFGATINGRSAVSVFTSDTTSGLCRIWSIGY